MYFNIVHGKKMSGSNSVRLNQLQRPGIEPGPAAWESDTLARSHTTSYLTPLFFSTYIVNIRVHFTLIFHLFPFIIKK